MNNIIQLLFIVKIFKFANKRGSMFSYYFYVLVYLLVSNFNYFYYSSKNAIKKIFYFTILVVILSFYAEHAFASKLPIPRFVSVKSSEVNMRAGPSVRYPILWTIIKKGEPLEVLAEFEHWRKVRDKQGDEAWIHESMLSGKRIGIVSGVNLQVIYNKSNNLSKKICMLDPELRVQILQCKKDWCLIQIEKCKGWISRNLLWGVYNNEEIR